MKYNIFEGNMERFNKWMKRIYNKCKKYGNDFSYEVLGEAFHEVDGETYKYYEVEVNGTAKVNDWEFIGVIEFYPEGNVIRTHKEVSIPEKYKTSNPYCEHCKTNRKRKDCYLVMNTKTGEFKQVGKTCLKDYTGGLSAEQVAMFIELMGNVSDFSAPDNTEAKYIWKNRDEVLRYAFECIRCFGYIKAGAEGNTIPTKAMVNITMANKRGKMKLDNKTAYIMETKKFNAEDDSVYEKVKSALEYISNLECENTFIHNMKLISKQEYVQPRDIGFLAYLPVMYMNSLEHEEKGDAKENSSFVGNVGEKISLIIQDVVTITGWMTQYGYTYVYKIRDEENNVYTWKTSKYLCDEDKGKKITGTVKSHNTYGNEKQTELTRCRF